MDMSPQEQRPIKIFISHSRKDDKWLKKLMPHLESLKQDSANSNLDIWHEGKITAGSNWEEAIKKSVQSADVAILLVSANFLASEFIKKNELQPLLLAAKERGALILPIIVSPCRYDKTPDLYQLQSVNGMTQALSKLDVYNQEEVFNKMADQIAYFTSNRREVLDEVTQKAQIDAYQKRSSERGKASIAAFEQPSPNDNLEQANPQNGTHQLTQKKKLAVWTALIIASLAVAGFLIFQQKPNGIVTPPAGTTSITAAKGGEASFGDLRIYLTNTEYEPQIGKFVVTANISLPGSEAMDIERAEEDMTYRYPDSQKGPFVIQINNADKKSAVFWISQLNK